MVQAEKQITAKESYIMSEVEAGEVKKGRGRPKKEVDPNAPPKAKKAASGRKYFVVDAEEYETFIAGKQTFVSMEAAMLHADGLATAAEDSGNPNIRLAVFEEAGILAAKVERKVVRDFASSRTLVRQAVEAASGAEGSPQTSAEPSPAGETPTAASTPSEAAETPETPPRRRR